ncbi:D-beta-hydroxybutyrate dehydrogenase isoform X1 [Magallana gigas]|uniref:D-beta-hydroxybutyrate dehydrogenase isoform X1 n=1 Tax=Magallana gigas TaxID=29159 RepID=UPI0033401BE3
MELQGRTALVTGFAGAIGSVIATSLANAGCDVIGVDKVKHDIVRMSIDEIKAESKRNVKYFQCDLINKEDIHKVFQDLKSGDVDILVNAAGRLSINKIEDLSDDVWDEDIGLNLTAPFVLIKLVIGLMKDKGWGRIINISSIMGIKATGSISSYIASKTGLIGLTRAVAVECADKGVTCNAICPTVVDTPFNKSFLEHLQTATGKSYEETKEAARQSHPTKQFTTPEQIADLVVFLCSPAGQNMTGTAIPIDGGVTIR